jgi:hypothetical protein
MEVAMRPVPSALRHGLLTLWICSCIAVPISHAGNGAIGIFTDTNASACDLRVSPGRTTTFYVVLAPDGTTRGGITGVEFQIDASKASGYLVMGELPMSNVTIQLGSAFSGGMNLVWAECVSQLTLPILNFQILNTGGGITDAPLLVGAHSDAARRNPLFDCPLVTLCDAPVFSLVCITGGAGILNSSFEVTCGSGAQRQKWSRVKALFR